MPAKDDAVDSANKTVCSELCKPVSRSATITTANKDDDVVDADKIVVNEVLAYVSCYRDSSNVEALRCVVLKFCLFCSSSLLRIFLQRRMC